MKKALDAKRAELGRPPGDPWTAEGDPGSATELSNDEYEQQASAEFDQAMALGDA